MFWVYVGFCSLVSVILYLLAASVGAFAELSFEVFDVTTWSEAGRMLLGVFVALIWVFSWFAIMGADE